MTKIYVSLEQAQRQIPVITRLMRDVMRLKRTLDELNTIEIEYDDTNGDEIDFIAMNKEFHRLSYQFYRKLELIEKKGCIVKDIDMGLVDFISLFNGREVCLCWRYGEDQIDYFHELDHGYPNRKPVKEIEQAESKEHKVEL